ncbi:glycosyltransferase [Microbacterium sp. NPDC057407]|uniref:glycosyltransferase n=1 Tax=Microbacterium sp. NPDC057407 TaxID=3346120 RepID=UPI0036727835
MTDTGRTIGCVVAAHEDERSIADVLTALLAQTRVPDVIHVVVENSSDDTVGVASRFAGPHLVASDSGPQFTEVFVHDIGADPGRRAGALQYGFSLAEGHDVLVCVEGDEVVDPDTVERALRRAMPHGPGNGRGHVHAHAGGHAHARTRSHGHGRHGSWGQRVAWLTLLAAAISVFSTLVRRPHGLKV